MTDVRAFDERRLPDDLAASGVTMMEKALWRALAEIDKAKARQDRERIARAGSLIVVVTDGCPTDEGGARKDLSPYLVRELADRNRTRSCETFAIGLGEVDDDVLRQVGPATSQVTATVRAWRSPMRCAIWAISGTSSAGARSTSSSARRPLR